MHRAACVSPASRGGRSALPAISTPSRGQDRHQPPPDRFRGAGLEVDGGIPPQDDVPRPILHAGQQVRDLPVDLAAEGLDRPPLLPGRLEILVPRRTWDELRASWHHTGPAWRARSHRRGSRCPAGSFAPAGPLRSRGWPCCRVRRRWNTRHSRFAAVGCGRPMRAGPASAEKSNTSGSRKNSVTPISSELTTFVTRWGFRSSSSRAAWVERTFKARKQAGKRRWSGWGR